MIILLFADIFLAFAKDPFRNNPKPTERNGIELNGTEPPNAGLAGGDLSVLYENKTGRRLDSDHEGGTPVDCKLYLAESNMFDTSLLKDFVDDFTRYFFDDTPGVTVLSSSISDIASVMDDFLIRIVTEYTGSEGSVQQGEGSGYESSGYNGTGYDGVRRLNTGRPSVEDMNEVMLQALITRGVVNADAPVDVNTIITLENASTVFTFNVSLVARYWEADLNIHEWGMPGGHCCSLRKSVAISNFPYPSDVRLFIMGLLDVDQTAETEFCDASTRYGDFGENQYRSCSEIPAGTDYVQGFHFVLRQVDKPSIERQLIIPSVCEAQVSKWEYIAEYKETCGDYTVRGSVECRKVGDVTSLYGTSVSCCENMETILQHYFFVLRGEENHVAKRHLEAAYGALSESIGCIDSILYSLTNTSAGESVSDRYKHVRAFTLDADLDCVFDRHQSTIDSGTPRRLRGSGRREGV